MIQSAVLQLGMLKQRAGRDFINGEKPTADL